MDWLLLLSDGKRENASEAGEAGKIRFTLAQLKLADVEKPSGIDIHLELPLTRKNEHHYVDGLTYPITY